MIPIQNALRRPLSRITGAMAACAVAGTTVFAGHAAGLAGEPAAGANVDETVADRVIVAPVADARTGVTVTFVTDAADAAVEYEGPDGISGTVAAGEKGTGEAGSHRVAALEGLTPGTAYRYRIVAGEGEDRREGPWRSFTTAPADPGPMDMIFWGDAQNGLDDEWVTSATAALEGVPDASLLLQAGDMVNSANLDAEWGQWYGALRDAPAQIPMLTALGNHELSGDVTARAFRNHFTHPANGPEVLDQSTYYVDYGGVRIVVLTANGLFLGQQARFLDEALASNPNEWSMVMFHQPVHNGTTKRNDPTYEIAFGDIIERHDVDLVLNGHDHTYARGHKTANVVDGVNTGPVYLVATAGSKFYPTAEDNPAWSSRGAERAVWAAQTSTYQRITVDACTMRVTAVVTVEGDEPVTSNGASGPGSVLDEFTIDKCGDGKAVS